MTDPQQSDWHEVEVRVRYCETDAMGLLHHSNYINYFEIARTDLLRVAGGSYRHMEEAGYFLVVVKVECDYKRPARYDDLLTVRARLERRTPAKLEHVYEVKNGSELIAEGRTILACVDREGTVRRITDDILFGTAPSPPDA